MSFLSEIHAYWAGNATLNTAFPASKVYTGLVPEGTSFPYGTITVVSSTPNFTTGKPYWESFRFQINVFDTDPDNVETLAAAVMTAFDYQPISAYTLSCERENYIFLVTPDTPARVFQATIEYVLNDNRSLN